jgi:hypothetical protein
MILSLPQRAQCTTTIVHLYPLGMIFAGAVPTFVNSKIEKINYLRYLFALGVRHGEESAAKAGSNGDLHPERRASRMQVNLFQK